MKFSSVYDIQAYLEAIDIENQEYLVWDADGTVLDLRTQRPVWVRMEEKTSDLGSLIRALRTYATSQGVELRKEPFSSAEIEELFDSILAKHI